LYGINSYCILGFFSLRIFTVGTSSLLVADFMRILTTFFCLLLSTELSKLVLRLDALAVNTGDFELAKINSWSSLGTLGGCFFSC
jgi:hypothetical protein